MNRFLMDYLDVGRHRILDPVDALNDAGAVLTVLRQPLAEIPNLDRPAQWGPASER
jgi:hypothetical protein